ncbi:hypothetical protein [Tolumonas lignilytica]|uniref:hypothetical protein n=1 Tax=Tolumonas lignilytica TaxID=1283284 RepID=UPI0012693DF2|nr:hypothetical protein [Tolumonas lignilytica]
MTQIRFYFYWICLFWIPFVHADFDEDDRAVDLYQITLPASQEEKMLFHDLWCNDESVCYGEGKFDKYVLSEMKNLRLNVNVFNQNGNLTSYQKKQKLYALHRAVYFAKQINVAVGGSLFDLIRRCSAPNSINNSYAQLDFDTVHDMKTMKISFFPVFKNTTTGEAEYMEFTFIRNGDKILPKRDLFSPDILQQKDFFRNYGIRCWS